MWSRGAVALRGASRRVSSRAVLNQKRGVAFVSSSEPSRAAPEPNNASQTEEEGRASQTNHTELPSFKLRGIRKDPESYMSSPVGTVYPGTLETFEPVQKLLGTKYALPQALVLQAVTHKSFAHAKMPYNEKLAIIGQQLLRMQISRAAAQAPADSPLLVNGLNFDINQRAVELLTSTPVLSNAAESAGLDTALFWRPTSESKNGIKTVRAKALQALAGAVLLHHGESAGREFVDEVVLGSPVSVFSIADKLFTN